MIDEVQSKHLVSAYFDPSKTDLVPLKAALKEWKGIFYENPSDEDVWFPVSTPFWKRQQEAICGGKDRVNTKDGERVWHKAMDQMRENWNELVELMNSLLSQEILDDSNRSLEPLDAANEINSERSAASHARTVASAKYEALMKAREASEAAKTSLVAETRALLAKKDALLDVLLEFFRSQGVAGRSLEP
jgi:hypothetical protein